MPLILDYLMRAHDSGVKFNIIGPDVKDFFDRVERPELYWATHGRIKDLQLWLVGTEVEHGKLKKVDDTELAPLYDGRWHRIATSDRKDVSVWHTSGDYWQRTVPSGEMCRVGVKTNWGYSPVAGIPPHPVFLHYPPLVAPDSSMKGYTYVAELGSKSRGYRKVCRSADTYAHHILLRARHGGVAERPAEQACIGSYRIPME